MSGSFSSSFRSSSSSFAELEKGPVIRAEPTDWRKHKSIQDRNLYMLTKQILCDTTVVVGENDNSEKNTFRVHSFVLASASSVFCKILEEQNSAKNLVIRLPTVKPEIFQIVLEYMYAEKLNCNLENIALVIKTANRLRIYGLMDACFTYLEGYISEGYVCALLEKGIKYRHTRLTDKCLRFIDKHISDIIKTKDFQQTTLESLMKIVPRDSLVIREDDLFDGLLEWAYSQCRKEKLPETPRTARKMLGDVFYQIRFPMMNPQNFTKKIANISILTDFEKVELFKFFYGAVKPQSRFSDRPRQWNKRASGILFIKPHPDIFSQGSFGSNMV